MIRRQLAIGWAAVISALLLTQRAAAEPQDAQAERALKKALEEDYLETRFNDAENRLRAAIKACGDDKCSRGLLAKLHAALGSVLSGGKKELEDARDEFIVALQLDPKIEPNPDIASAAVTFSFEQAQKQLKLKATGPPSPGPPPLLPTSAGLKSKPSPYDDGSDAAPSGKATPEPDKPPRPVRVRRHWIALSFVTDLSIISGENVCHKDVRIPEHFVCLRKDGIRYRGNPTLDVGDNLNTGLGLSTFRLMLGYDGLISDHVSLGGRVGFAFNGASGADVSFIPFHAEGRFSYWPRSRSFTDAIVRPYVMVAAGFAQIDTKVSDVETLEDGDKCGAMDPTDPQSPCSSNYREVPMGQRKLTLTVYKQAGLGFAVLGGGLQLAPVPNFGINIGLRGGLTFPALTAVFAPEVGLSLGF